MSSSLPDSFTFPLVIKACSQINDPKLFRLIHTHVLVMGFGAHLHVANELVAMYSNLGLMEIARKVFDGMPDRNVVSWNLLVSGFSSSFDPESAMRVFRLMQVVGPAPNLVTWTSLMSAHARCKLHGEVVEIFDEMRCSGVRGSAEAVAVVLSICAYLERDALKIGKKMHSYVQRIGFENYPFVRNSLVCMYGKLGFHEEAEIVFSETEEKSLVSWNALISSYAASGLCNKACEVFYRLSESNTAAPNVVSWSAVIKGFASAGMAESSLSMFQQMQQAGIRPNPVTIATILSSCAEISALDLGKEIHCHMIRISMNKNILVDNALLNMYTKSGNLRNGMLILERIKEKDLISWNTMITGFGMHGFCDEALATFEDMIKNNVNPDGITFISLLSGCSHAGNVAEGRRLLHRMIHEFNIPPAMEHYSCLVDLLGRAGLLIDAYELVQEMPFPPNASVIGALLNSCRIHGKIMNVEDCATRILEIDGEGSGNYMLLSNIYAASGRWGESARVRAMTKERGVKKKAGESWVKVGKKAVVFSSDSSPSVEAEVVYGVVEVLCQHMESQNVVSGDWIVLM
ncbi:uncharacterized protein A4U43_UnF5500 [Asparagus officinalis]|uniref:Pentatricopeptide repeat-containing protein n=1 Tax=Asparagus officinalis TaxID=4686 RepID=A0A1R3L6Q0_ASPOF|nr:putative pentatricopeptide repeat-containing protein At1g17630 [Asparagus officinalis]ONK55286.1 uncharacterized protein A4U43_UnF5500 [Asparagus officinalis]